MNRNRFVKYLAVCSGTIVSAPSILVRKDSASPENKIVTLQSGQELKADLVICGGGLGGCAAALAALRNDLRVIMTEETRWIGGQISQQGVPPDEHQWIETHGCTKLYRTLRNRIREYYFKNYQLTSQARNQRYFNPGNGSVSRLCHEPRVAVAVLNDMLAPYLQSGKLTLLTGYKLHSAEVISHTIRSVAVNNPTEGKTIILTAPYFIDATETGDLLPLSGTSFITGSEAAEETHELHAGSIARPGNNQAFTMCFAMDYLPGEDHTIEKPAEYDFWTNYKPALTPPWPGKLISLSYSNPSGLKPRELAFDPEGNDTGPLLNLWEYRRIIDRKNFSAQNFPEDITVVNWPQNDFMAGNLIGAGAEEFKRQVERSKQLSLSLLYWLQTEAPLRGKGYGWKGLRLRKDIMGTDDGFAMHPYIRESRRIKARFTVLEEHVGKENRELVSGQKKVLLAKDFYDTIGIGYYHIDLHPTCGGDNYIDFDSLPFQIPLGALIPEHTENLIPACKNIGTTHITNGCFRLHPVEWNLGESAGALVAFALHKKLSPSAIYENKQALSAFQDFIRQQGIETHWPV